MINSYNSFPKPKIIVIHGLNNNSSSFMPLVEELKARSYTVELLILPGHGENRQEVKNLEEAKKAFDRSMEKFTDQEYVILAFSHGALYSQLWLKETSKKRPAKQILLAPALFVRKQKIVLNLLKILPPFFLIISFAPKNLRRYPFLRVDEYKILSSGMQEFQKIIPSSFSIPTLIIVDPKDELVDVKNLKKELGTLGNGKIQEIRRESQKFGTHHLIFHPDYFNREEWNNLLNDIESFISSAEV